jgi:hypothetical protein
MHSVNRLCGIWHLRRSLGQRPGDVARTCDEDLSERAQRPVPDRDDSLNDEINAALGDPKIKAGLADLGATALPGSPADFGKLIADETEQWGRVIRAANIKPEQG